MPDQRPPGLRERKKLDTRRALSDAAVELVYERGFENITREDIADRAGVAPRTFSNYFAGKYDAVAYRVSDRIRRSAELLRGRPADESLWTAIAEAMVEPLREDAAAFGQPTQAQLAEVWKLNATPEMQAAVARATIGDLVGAIADRTGTQAHDLYPRLVAEVTVSTVRVVLERFPNADPPASILTLLREAFAAVAVGLPAPPS